MMIRIQDVPLDPKLVQYKCRFLCTNDPIDYHSNWNDFKSNEKKKQTTKI